MVHAGGLGARRPPHQGGGQGRNDGRQRGTSDQKAETGARQIIIIIYVVLYLYSYKGRDRSMADKFVSPLIKLQTMKGRIQF